MILTLTSRGAGGEGGGRGRRGPRRSTGTRVRREERLQQPVIHVDGPVFSYKVLQKDGVSRAARTNATVHTTHSKHTPCTSTK